MHIRHETSNYVLSQDHHGFFQLVRKNDGASLFFQGDDAELWERNMTALEGIAQWNAGNTLDKSFNFLCDGYDDLLEK